MVVMVVMVKSISGCLQSMGLGDVDIDGANCDDGDGGDHGDNDGDDDGDHHVVVDRDDGCPQQGSGKKGDFDNGPLCSIYGGDSAWTESCEVFILYFSLDVLSPLMEYPSVTNHLWVHNYTLYRYCNDISHSKNMLTITPA